MLRSGISVPKGLIGGFLLFLGGCHPSPMVDLVPPPVSADQTVVTVNGEPLSLEDFDTEFRLMEINYSAVSEGPMRAIKRRLFEQVINRRLLLQQARKDRLGLTQDEVNEAFRDALSGVPEEFTMILKTQGVSEDAWKRKLLQERLAEKVVDLEVNSKVKITDDEVADYYWTHLSDYWKPEEVRVRHLVVQRKSDLDKVLAALKKDEDFAQLASTFSVGPERAQGGDWGFLPLDSLPSNFVKTIEALRPGEISRPLKDGFGYHLFQSLDRHPRRMQTLEEVRDTIHDSLLKEEQDLRFDQWMGELKRKADIRVNQGMAPVIGVTLEGSREE